jgi:choline dehydrogenase-like flavoprotein
LSLNGDPIGVARQPTNLREEDYSRSYSPRFLEHANDNIVLKLGTRVAKVNIDERKKATGITLEDGSILKAGKEVILSAGTFHSPGLLELSGIGNSDILANAGIETLYNLPGLGENHQDHVRVQASYILQPGLLSFDRLTYNATYAAEQLALWYANESSEYDATAGAFAFMPWVSVSGNLSTSLLSLARESVNGTSSSMFKKQLQHLSDNSVPQLELVLSNNYGGAKGYPKPTDPLYGVEMFTISGGIMHPFSRGSIHISSANISIPPTLNPNYLSSPVDFTALVSVAKYIRQVASTPPLADVWTSEYEPGTAVQSDEDWESYVRTILSSFDHPIGTCSMLPEKDGGVVSSELKVYGVDGLRVVDASIIPLAVSGHIQTAVYGIAERAAELIIRDWK